MQNLTEGNISKNFLAYAIPVILAGVLTQAYGLIDSVVIGKLLGETGLAAVGATDTLITVIQSILWGFAMGIAIYISMLYGGKKYEKMANAIKVNMILLTVMAVGIAVTITVLYNPIFKMLSIGDDIYDDSLKYYIITVFAVIFQNINWTSVYILNGIGQTSFPLKISLISGGGGVLLKFLFIKVLGLGVTGAALATIIVTSVCSLMYIVKFSGIFKELNVSGYRPDFNLKEIRQAWKQGIPCMFQQMVMYVAPFAIQPMINGMGSAQIAALSVCNMLYKLNAVLFQQSSKTLSAFCSQCMGAGKYGIIKKGVWIAFKQSFLVSLPVMALCMLFPKNIASLFYNDVSGESAGYVIRYIYLCMPFVTCQVVNNMFHNFYRGVMKPIITTITSVFYSVIRLIVTYILIGRFEMDGVFAGFIVAWMGEMILQLAIYISGKWKTKAYIEAESKN